MLALNTVLYQLFARSFLANSSKLWHLVLEKALGLGIRRALANDWLNVWHLLDIFLVIILINFLVPLIPKIQFFEFTFNLRNFTWLACVLKILMIQGLSCSNSFLRVVLQHP